MLAERRYARFGRQPLLAAAYLLACVHSQADVGHAQMGVGVGEPTPSGRDELSELGACPQLRQLVLRQIKLAAGIACWLEFTLGLMRRTPVDTAAG
jgi:hypothetical protein